jgi:mannitol-specific phosphotransferase system IIBC component
VAEEVVDIIIVAEGEEINIILAVVAGMVAECSNSSRMINTTKEVDEEEVVAAAGTTKATIRAMGTSTKADTAVEAEGEDIGAVEVRTRHFADNQC